MNLNVNAHNIANTTHKIKDIQPWTTEKQQQIAISFKVLINIEICLELNCLVCVCMLYVWCACIRACACVCMWMDVCVHAYGQ